MKKFKDFLKAKGISEDDLQAKTAEELAELHSEWMDETIKSFETQVANGATKADIKTELDAFKTELAKNSVSKTQIDEMQEAIDQLKEVGYTGKDGKNPIKKAFTAKIDSIKKMVSEKSGVVEFEVKAAHNPTDIADRDVYAELDNTTNRKPFRSFSIIDLFKRKPMKGEFLKYREEDTVTRDGKVVVACATSTHNTKKSWKIETVQVAKVRDMTDVCLDMIEDYDFVESEIKDLVTEGVTAKEEQEILSGTGDVLSIGTISSEFSATNVLAPYNASFDVPTLAELTAAMKGQIFTFGAENKWDANAILMNHNDKVKFMHQKNANGDYLLPNFVMSNGGILNGMVIVTSPLVAPNTLYVMDTNQACILDRKTTTVEMFYENKDNAEHEVVTIKALKIMQFHVKKIDRNAFMKCSDIAAALTAIAKS